MPPQEILKHSSGSVSVGFLHPGAHKVLFVPSKSLIPLSCVSSGGSMVGLRAASPRGLMPYPGLLHPEPLPLQQATADPYIHRRYSEFWLSLCGLGVCFVPFPIWKSSSNQVLHECTVPGEPYIHLLGPEPCIHLLCSGPSFSWVCCESTVSDVPYVSSGELISDCDLRGGCQPSRISERHG